MTGFLLARYQLSASVFASKSMRKHFLEELLARQIHMSDMVLMQEHAQSSMHNRRWYLMQLARCCRDVLDDSRKSDAEKRNACDLVNLYCMRLANALVRGPQVLALWMRLDERETHMMANELLSCIHRLQTPMACVALCNMVAIGGYMPTAKDVPRWLTWCSTTYRDMFNLGNSSGSLADACLALMVLMSHICPVACGDMSIHIMYVMSQGRDQPTAYAPAWSEYHHMLYEMTQRPRVEFPWSGPVRRKR